MLTDDEKLMILEGRLIEAVKAARYRLQVSLSIAKDLVDEYRVQEGLVQYVEEECSFCKGKGRRRHLREVAPKK